MLERTPFRVLSLDGGGMRGTYMAIYLDRVASAFARQRNLGAVDIGMAFNLIVGASTGGIIACALAQVFLFRPSSSYTRSRDGRSCRGHFPSAWGLISPSICSRGPVLCGTALRPCGQL